MNFFTSPFFSLCFDWKLCQRRLFLIAIFLSAVSRIEAQQYRVSPEDVLSITVLYHPEFSQAQVTVPSSGHIQVPGVGDLFVVGKTTTALDKELTRRLLKQLQRPEVTVALLTPRTKRVFLIGAVSKPGAYELKSGFRVSEALALAGGLTVRPEQAHGVLR